MSKRTMIALGIFGIFYIGFGAFLAIRQERIIYQPWEQDFENCSSFREAEKVTHNGTRMYVKKNTGGMAVLYHGNAGSACDRLFYAQEFSRAGYGYVIVEYAGYSNDTQTPTHELVKQDVQNVISYIEQSGTAQVVVVGESIGAGPASYHASRKTPEHLILISPFASLSDIARRTFWFYPTSLMVDNAFDNISLLASYDGPATIIHGDTDNVISQKSGLLLYENLETTQKEFISIEGKGHNDIFTSSKAIDAMQTALR